MIFGAFDPAEIEIRRGGGGARLRGRFPYRKRAVLSDGGRNGGRPQKEEFEPGAFSYRLDMEGEDIHLLLGHDYNQPLASRATDTLIFNDTREALNFSATITPEIADTSHGSDALALIESGLSVGISPGFRIPPPRAVPADKAQKVTQEPINPAKGQHGALIRTIFAALLYELSVVTVPAYKEATITSDRKPVDENHDGIDDVTGEKIVGRSWELTESGVAVPRPSAILRYR